MSTVMLPEPVGHITEFAGGFNGTCTQAALAVCLAAAKGEVVSTDFMLTIVKDMLAKKLCAANGAATVGAVALEARELGYQTSIEWDYTSAGFDHDWVSVLRDYAGIKPILLQVSNGLALKDFETGVGDESGLHYHAIAIVGKQDDGYICADGDNPQVTERFQIYNLTVLAAAQPCGLLLVEMQREPPPPVLPAGWSEKDGQYSANGCVVVGEFATWVSENKFALGLPLTNSWVEGADTYQTFQYGELCQVAKALNVVEVDVGADLVKLRAQIAAIAKALTA